MERVKAEGDRREHDVGSGREADGKTNDCNRTAGSKREIAEGENEAGQMREGEFHGGV
jgi:hypothetical protein